MLRGDERDVEVGRETKRKYRMAEEGEMAKNIKGRLKKKKKRPKEDSSVGGVDQFNTHSHRQYKLQ